MREEILQSLNIDEKIRLLNGVGSWHTYDANGKLPKIMMSDGPHGLRCQNEENYSDINKSAPSTCFPSLSSIGNSWDKNLAKTLGETLANECKHFNVSMLLAPGVNIKRSPLCGRNFEYFSEDPYLAGELASHYVDGVQENGVGVSLKHFACNSQEKSRQTQNSLVDDRTMFEIYLSAFERVIKICQPSSVMGSYNRLNGTYACANSFLLNEVLRERWGFNGFVVSDWGAGIDIVDCIKNGLNLEMPDSAGLSQKFLKEAFDKGEITEKEIDDALSVLVEKILEFEKKLEKQEVDFESHHNKAIEMASQCAVLLKNEDILLPLKKEQKLLVVGEMAIETRHQGGGSSHVNCTKLKTHLDILKENFDKVDYENGYNDNKIDPKSLSKIKQLAISCDTILFYGGLTNCFEGEGFDRIDLNLPSAQVEVLKEILTLKKDVVFVLTSGSSVFVPCLESVKSVLQINLSGQGVAESTAMLLLGEKNPSGKLSETYAFDIKDIPSTKNFGDTKNVFYKEGLFVGYRYFETFNEKTQFEFGYGLSYTNFEYSNLKITSNEIDKDSLKLTVDVENTGKVQGKEVVQVYVKNPQGKLVRAKVELVAFDKIDLMPAEKKTVEFKLNKRNFSIYDNKTKDFVCVNGDYEILVGASVKDIREKKEIVIDCGVDMTSTPEILTAYSNNNFEISDELFSTLFVENKFELFVPPKKGEYTIYNSLNELAETSKLARFIRWGIAKFLRFSMRHLKKDDPAVTMMIFAMSEAPLTSLIANSGGMIKEKYMQKLLKSANKTK